MNPVRLHARKMVDAPSSHRERGNCSRLMPSLNDKRNHLLHRHVFAVGDNIYLTSVQWLIFLQSVQPNYLKLLTSRVFTCTVHRRLCSASIDPCLSASAYEIFCLIGQFDMSCNVNILFPATMTRSCKACLIKLNSILPLDININIRIASPCVGNSRPRVGICLITPALLFPSYLKVRQNDSSSEIKTFSGSSLCVFPHTASHCLS